LFNTTNSNLPGGHTLYTGEETLGKEASAEKDANDSEDPDGVPNLVDADRDEGMFVILDGTRARLSFVVSVNQTAPDVTRYINILVDFDQNGNWSAGGEWVIVNMEVNVSPGSSKTIVTPSFLWSMDEGYVDTSKG
jgi:hypothetical protein